MTDLNSLKIGDLISTGEEYRFSSVVRNGNNESVLFRNLTLPDMKVTYFDKDYILVKKIEPILLSVDIMILNKSAKQ
jgi:hypothetical protein